MRKLFIAEVILYLCILILIHRTESDALFLVLLGLYALAGYQRKYYEELDIAYAVGFVQNIVALVIAYLLLLVLSFKIWQTNNLLTYAFFFIPLAIFQFFGMRRYFLRLLAWLVFFPIWTVMMIVIFAPPEFAFNIRDCSYFGILLLGMRIFEVTFETYANGRTEIH